MHHQTCILIDDEAHALGTLADIVQKIPGLTAKGQYDDGIAALASAKVLGKVDFIFSDIEMPGLSGIEAAKLLRPYCQYLIFTTAHGHYALEAFGEDADGFLLKPLSLAIVLEKVEKIRQKEIIDDPSSEIPQSLFLKNGNKNGYVRIGYNDIVCIDAGDHYPTIVTKTEQVTVYMTMHELDEYLSDKGDFVRIHKSCIISLDKVTHIDGNTVYLDTGAGYNRKISESYRQTFFDLVNKQTLVSSKKK